MRKFTFEFKDTGDGHIQCEADFGDREIANDDENDFADEAQIAFTIALKGVRKNLITAVVSGDNWDDVRARVKIARGISEIGGKNEDG